MARAGISLGSDVSPGAAPGSGFPKVERTGPGSSLGTGVYNLPPFNPEFDRSLDFRIPRNSQYVGQVV